MDNKDYTNMRRVREGKLSLLTMKVYVSIHKAYGRWILLAGVRSRSQHIVGGPVLCSTRRRVREGGRFSRARGTRVRAVPGTSLAE